jgi:hypothetical protein
VPVDHFPNRVYLLHSHGFTLPEAATRKNKNRNTEKQKNNQIQKRKTQNPTPRSLPPYSEVTGTRGRRLRLAGLSVCNRTAAGQPDVELLCPIGLLFGRTTMVYPKIPLLWVVKIGLKARDSSGWWHSQR